MAYRVEFSDRARAQTDSAYLYLSQRSPEAAVRWFNGLEAALVSLAESLETLPGRRSFAPENGMLPDMELFQLIYGKAPRAYRVLYCLIDAAGTGKTDTLRVLHVRHGAQKRLNEEITQ